MKLNSVNKRLVLATAVAAALFGSGSAFAQHRVDNGNARDSNNRLGSGGYNTGGTTSTNPYAMNNNIVTGNVTGGREFRGFVPYTDPGAFRGPTSGVNTDRFVRQSAGVPIGVYNNNNAQNVTSFYGDSRGTAPPPGFSQQAIGQGAVRADAAARTHDRRSTVGQSVPDNPSRFAAAGAARVARTGGRLPAADGDHGVASLWCATVEVRRPGVRSIPRELH